MRYRTLGRTGFDVSEVSFGSWAIGGSWGYVDDAESMKTLHRAVDRIKPLVPAGWTMPRMALRWILMFDAVSCVIPGGRPEQVDDNVAATDLPPSSDDVMAKLRPIYDDSIRPLVHQRS